MPNLLKETIKLANQTDLPVDDVCKKAKVTRRWFMYFKAGRYKDPGVSKVERVNKILSETNP